jgi:integrase
LFDLAIDSKLRGCDLVRVRIGDIVTGDRIRDRALVIQRKTGRPVQFEILEPARSTLLKWLERRGGSIDEFAFPSRCDHSTHLSTRQYGRLVDEWVAAIGLKPQEYPWRSSDFTGSS